MVLKSFVNLTTFNFFVLGCSWQAKKISAFICQVFALKITKRFDF